MDEFLDLQAELDLANCELRDLLEGRAAITREVRSLAAGETSDDDEIQARIDGLIERGESIDAAIEAAEQEQRAARISRFTTQRERRSNASRQPAPVLAHNRAPEARSEDPLDPVLFPDAGEHPYSLMRAIRMRANNQPLDGKEAEVSQEIATRADKPAQGFYIPWTLPTYTSRSRPRQPGYESRDFDTTAGAGGIPAIQSGTVVDLLRHKLVMARMGAEVLTDMVGTFDLPKLTGGGSAYWISEGSGPTESAQAVGQVQFSPATVGAFTDITRRLIKQASFDAERLVRSDLLQVLQLELDRVGLNGSGTGEEPEGILQNGSVGVVALGVNGAAPTWDMVVDLETGVAADNADLGNLGYVTSANGRGALKKTAKDAGSGLFLWDGAELNGYQAFASNQIPSDLTKAAGTGLTAMVFGNYADAVYAFWGAIDVLVDPYTLSSSGGVRVVFLADADFQLRRTESFQVCVDIDPAA